MGWAESIQQAINYLEDHLLDEIEMEAAAREAGSSVFHFQRTFSILTDMTAGEYVRRRRLTLAAQELIASDVKVIDLAYRYGYETPEAFTKAFRRQHGVAPRDAARYVGRLKFYQRLAIQVTLKGAEPMKYKVVEREAFQAAGIKRGYSLVNDENLREIPKLWEEVNGNGTTSRLMKLNNGRLKGVLGICSDQRSDGHEGIEYWVAAECSEKAPGGFETVTVPASKWAVFEVKGPMPEAMQKTWKQIYSEWFPASGYKHAGTAELEFYPEAGGDRGDFYSEIWIPVTEDSARQDI